MSRRVTKLFVHWDDEGGSAPSALEWADRIKYGGNFEMAVDFVSVEEVASGGSSEGDNP